MKAGCVGDVARFYYFAKTSSTRWVEEKILSRGKGVIHRRAVSLDCKQVSLINPQNYIPMPGRGAARCEQIKRRMSVEKKLLFDFMFLSLINHYNYFYYRRWRFQNKFLKVKIYKGRFKASYKEEFFFVRSKLRTQMMIRRGFNLCWIFISFWILDRTLNLLVCLVYPVYNNYEKITTNSNFLKLKPGGSSWTAYFWTMSRRLWRKID